MPSKTPVPATTLPRPVINRIQRYAAEGRVPTVRYEHNQCLLLATANWELPIVVLRSPRREFSGMHTAALTEWARAARHAGKRKSS